MNYIARGLGLALGLALWPIALPVFLLLGVAAALRGDLKAQPDCCGEVPPSPGHPLADDPTALTDMKAINPEVIPAPRTYAGPQLPVLPKSWRAQQMAQVNERNRQHLENTYRN